MLSTYICTVLDFIMIRNMTTDKIKEMQNEEMHWARTYLGQGLILLGLEYPERLGILMALKTKEQIWQMLWWIRCNLERKPTQEEIMDVFADIAKPNSVTFEDSEIE